MSSADSNRVVALESPGICQYRSLARFFLEITLEMTEASQNQWLSCMFFKS